MATIYTRAESDVIGVVKASIKKYHPDLAEADVKVCVLMAMAEKDDKGEPLGPALKLHGVQALAIAKIIPYKQRAAGREDCEITIDEDWWKTASPPERDAIVDHELCHFEITRDSEGGVKSDDMGRPKLKTRHHDRDYGFFDGIARRHGDASQEVKQSKAFADSCGQLYWGWGAPSGGVEMKPAKIPQKKSVQTADGRHITPDEMMGEIATQFSK